MWTRRYSIKWTTLFGPFSTWTVHNSLDNAVTRLPLTPVCPPLLIDSIIIALVHTVLASGQPFTQAYSKGSSRTYLCNTQQNQSALGLIDIPSEIQTYLLHNQC